MRHYHGFNSEEAKEALERHDKRLGDIINTLIKENMNEESTIVLLGDHSSLDEMKLIKLNVLLKQKGYIDLDKEGRVLDYRAIAKSCDGSSYVYVKEKNDYYLINNIHDDILSLKNQNDCIERIYSNEEAEDLGADANCTFMLEGNLNYYFSGSCVFYDAFLVDITTKEKMDKVSTKGFELGYIGSTIPFIISMSIVVLAQYKKIPISVTGKTNNVVFNIIILFVIGGFVLTKVPNGEQVLKE